MFISIKRRMSFIVVCTLFLLANYTQVHAATFTAFDPKVFTRGSGKPVTETASFTIKNPNTTYTLKIYNGGTNSEYSKVSSAVIKLNGTTIFEESDFNQQVASLQKQVSVGNTNQLQIELRSAPGSRLTALIEGEDNTPPSVIINSPANGTYTNTPTAAVSGTASDAISWGSTVTVNGTTATLKGEAYNSSIRLTEGLNTVTAIATDAAGNTGNAMVSVILDTTPPKITIDPVPSMTNKPHLTITGKIEDASPISSFTINGSPANITNKTFTATVNLTEGNNNIIIAATDMAGNTGGTTTQVLLDVTPPTGSIFINNGTAYTNKTSVNVAFTCNDSGSGCGQMQFRSDNINWTAPETYAASKVWTLTSGDGTKTVYVKFVDNAGNWSDSYSATTTLDTTPLAFTTSSPAANSYINTARIGYTLSEAATAGSITFTWTGGPEDTQTPHIYNFTSSDMTAGTHSINTGFPLISGAVYTISFDATDAVGNAATTVSNANITYDTTATSVTINSPASISIVNNTNVSYTLSKDIAAGNIIFTRTGGSTDTASPHIYSLTGTDTTKGTHTINTNLSLTDGSIYTAGFQNVADLAGNISADISNANIKYDITAVSITSTTPSANSSINTATASYTMSETASAGKVTFTWTGGNADSNSPQVYTMTGPDLTSGAHAVNINLNLTDGAIYTVSFDATDLAGNQATTVSNAMVKFDKTPPALSITSPTNGSTVTTNSITVTGTIDDNTVTINVNGVSATIANNTFTATGIQVSPGTNTIIATATDKAGNTSSSSITVQLSTGPTTVGGRISSDTTWTLVGSPYIVTSTVQVYGTTTTPVTLTIQPGVVVKFASGTGLQIASGTNQGAIIARGTAANRITLTRSGVTGTWSGLTFNDGTVDSTTVLDYADIQYSTGMTMSTASPVIRNSTITDVTGYITLSSSNPTMENVTITNNSTYGIYLAASSPVITGGSLTNTNTSGYGIYGSGSPVISNYNLSIVNSAGKYGVYMSSPTSALSITNSTIGNGLYLASTSITPTITGNTFTNSDPSPIHAGANIIAQILGNNNFNGMTSGGRIEIIGEQVIKDSLWKKWTAPYVVVSGTVNVFKDTITASTLTIDPGVTVKFVAGTSLQIGSGSSRGAIAAQGTADNKIIFTSSQAAPAPGNWNGVTLSGAGSGLSLIEYVTIEYAGSGANYYNANLTINSAAPVIRNCIIRNSAGSGIYLNGATSGPVITDSQITGNKWGVYSDSSNLNVSNSPITGNTTAGVWNASTTMNIDARDNWWGAASGPTYTSNPLGTGDKVSSNVLYNPWLGQIPGPNFIIAEAKALPTSMNPLGDYIAFAAKASASANWNITVTDGNNAAIRSFALSGTAISQKWYGEDNLGNKVADGFYYYSIQAVNSVTGDAASAPMGLLLVSRQLPIAVLDPPSDNQMFTGGTTINVTGTASDSTDFKNYTLDYGVGENPASWTSLKTATSTPVTNGPLYAWNTSALTGSLYTLRLTVTDNAGNIAVETSRVRLLWTQNVSASEGYISPNADNIKDSTTISASFTYQSNWTVTIKSFSGAAVRTFTGTAASVTQVWDGKDNAGFVVPDGIYTYQIDAVNPETNIAAATKTGTVVVDTTLPTAQITSPTASALLRNTVSVLGTAADINFDNYHIEYGPASGSGPWTLIGTANTSVTSGSLTTWVTNDQTNAVLTQNGSYILRLVASDKSGNVSATTLTVSIDNLILFGISISSHTLNTYSSQTDTVYFAINGPSAVTLKIIPEKLGATGAPVYQVTQNYPSSGAYSLTWNGNDGTGKAVPDEAYLYILEASDGTRTDRYNPSALIGTGSVTCTKEATFAPYKNDPLTITYNLVQAARLNINISWGSQNFKILDAFADVVGSHTYDWDGRNPTGKLLDDGAGASCTVASLLRENHIVTTGDTPRANVLQTDPYTMHLAYGQFTRIKYTLSRGSNVTVNLVSPTGATITLVNNQFQSAGPQKIDWYGTDSADTTGKKTLVSEAGDYIVSVQAVNPVTGTSSTARGNLKIGY